MGVGGEQQACGQARVFLQELTHRKPHLKLAHGLDIEVYESSPET